MHLAGKGAQIVASSSALRCQFGAIAYSIHRHGVMTESYSLKPGRNAGFLDLQQATYLPFAGLFVTDDENQFKALTSIAKCVGEDPKVVALEEVESLAREMKDAP